MTHFKYKFSFRSNNQQIFIKSLVLNVRIHFKQAFGNYFDQKLSFKYEFDETRHREVLHNLYQWMSYPLHIL